MLFSIVMYRCLYGLVVSVGQVVGDEKTSRQVSRQGRPIMRLNDAPSPDAWFTYAGTSTPPTPHLHMQHGHLNHAIET